MHVSKVIPYREVFSLFCLLFCCLWHVLFPRANEERKSAATAGNSARYFPYEFPVYDDSDAAHLETILICFLPAMSLDGPSSSRPVSKDEIGTSHNNREDREPGVLDAAAGPSNTTEGATKLKRRSKAKGSGVTTPVPPGEQKSPAVFEEPSFENNGDFIAFGLDDEPRVLDNSRKQDEEEPLERDWEQEKGKMRECDGGGGKKRKGDFDRNDGYNNKKARTDAASRKAPWVTDVDWEGSANVAELWAFFF